MINQIDKSQIINLIKDFVSKEDFEIYQISCSKNLTFEILVDKKDRSSVKLSDCSFLCKMLTNTIYSKYPRLYKKILISVSSVGIERELRTIEDYKFYINQHVRIITSFDDPKSFSAQIIQINLDMIDFLLEDKTKLSVNIKDIKKSNIVFTKNMFRKSLNKGKI